MCGIWCSIGFQPEPMRIDLVRHRGPDGRGWQVFDTIAGPLVLAHRRLSIIDLSDAGLQPMQYSDGRYWLVFNGEIYNYLELRNSWKRWAISSTPSRTAKFSWPPTHAGAKPRSPVSSACLHSSSGIDSGASSSSRDRFGIKPL